MSDDEDWCNKLIRLDYKNFFLSIKKMSIVLKADENNNFTPSS